ncbi:hypothetical protein Tco_0860928 [Tanacetum coccineum]|uniref:Reverse transcriptase domain-containing protein n=1 Tax=Tanacetum coccineum TaxID=301880 RepID=A0ABQ5BGU5_9ASTR
MMKKVDDFLKSEEAYKSTELPRGEFPDKGQRTSYRGNRPPRAAYGGGQQRTDNHNTFNRKDHSLTVCLPEQEQRYDNRSRKFTIFIRDALPSDLSVLVRNSTSTAVDDLKPKRKHDRYLDYHGEKGHCTNDCYQLKRQLEAALEFEKLNHLIKDIRQRHFKTLSLDKLRSPDFNLLSDQEYSKEEVTETMAETMEQYMSKTRADYGTGVARPKIEDKDNFELKGQFLKELRTNTFSSSDHEDANEHIEKVLKILDLFHVPNITIDQVMLSIPYVLK